MVLQEGLEPYALGRFPNEPHGWILRGCRWRGFCIDPGARARRTKRGPRKRIYLTGEADAIPTHRRDLYGSKWVAPITMDLPPAHSLPAARAAVAEPLVRPFWTKQLHVEDVEDTCCCG